MKKEEILEKSRKSGLDEREEKIEGDSNDISLIFVLALTLIFAIWNLMHGVYSYDLYALFTACVAGRSIYKYSQLKSGKLLAASILGITAVIASTIAFFIGG
ncbi:DUF6442 family protein [Paenibacillus puerhi]|uniref:DUF6442 family protein n=1 Tax=Paenibacillus puerhi TaxID=2692622 RepID=UPI0013588A18|nr:DUF6442 family protein [Paenibacillus puerhi]